jgi:parallel beta-helix repeat protein
MVFGIDCTTQSINDSLRFLRAGDTLLVIGVCNEHVAIGEEFRRITLDGRGTATISGPTPGSPTINIRGQGITIRGFNINGGETGIAVNKGGTATIDRNIIQNAAAIGILVGQKSSARIVNNTIQNNPEEGILVNENSFARIGFLNASDAGTSPNLILMNGDSGIHVTRSSSARIIGNTISNTTAGSGIIVRRVSHAEISSNTINGNSEHGIFVTENSGVNLGRDTGDGFFDSPNSTAVNNTQNGIRCLLNSHANGRLGPLNGAAGAKNFTFTNSATNSGVNSGGCHDSLLP